MTTVGVRERRHVQRTAPRWPVVWLVAMTTLAIVSITQGIVDIVVPALIGREPFQFLFWMTGVLGPAFLGVYLFVHNVGLACIVPGFGFLASRYEKHVTNRARIGMILLGAVLASLFVALEFLIQAADQFNLAFSLALFTVEAVAVLTLAFPSARQLKGFVPTRVYSWALVTPFRKLRVPLVASLILLVLASAVETVFLFAA